jgi:hypothetical protein
MPTRRLDAIMYVGEVPSIFYEEGLFHVGYDVGQLRAEFVMPPRVFFSAIAEAVEVSRKHKRGKVVPIGGHAASDRGKASK